MDPAGPSTPPAPGDTGPKPAKGTLAEAAESLAPFRTQFAHRPDWRAAADDAAEAERDRSQEG